MAEKKQSSSALLWILFFIAIAILTAVFLYPLYKTKNEQLEKLEKSKKNEAAIKKILDQKKSKADALENSKEAVEREARTKFGMGKENETVLRYEK
ncbi:MAG: hypothetical protein E7058_07035 [Lentisphaerae bacterium]|nr:hypothetical protein [Lentisphaerota bacterium]